MRNSKMPKRGNWIMVMLLLTASLALNAQAAGDTIPAADSGKSKAVAGEPYHRNVIKFNPTPMLLWGDVRNITLSYERLIGNQHSMSVQAGYLLFPRLFDDTIVSLVSLTSRSKYGVNLAFDYRYYPGARNRRPAPDGLYVGAYLSYYGFNFQNHFDILNTTIDQNGAFKGKLNFVNLGVDLGYQFVFWKRFTLDLLMFGPSLSYYSGKFSVSGDLDEEQIQEIDEELVQKLFSRFPLLKAIFTSEDLQFTGSRTKLSLGFRYSIQLGFHF